MYRYQSCKARGDWSEGLADGRVRLIDAQYFALFLMVDMIGNNSIEHGVTQPVEQAVNANTNNKRNKMIG